MFRRLFIGLVLLASIAAAVGAGVYRFCPGIRVRIMRHVADVGGWNEEARRADPVGFVEHARQRLHDDLEAMQRTRRQLAAEIGQLSNELREQQAMHDHARTLAEQFRAEYRLASENGGFPIEVRLAAYTEAEAVSQVSSLLAEAEGYEAAVAKLEEVKQEAESELEALTVRMNETESQLAALTAEGILLEVRMLSQKGEKLLAQVDQLLHGNAEMIAANPVRNVRELLDADRQPAKEPTRREAAVAFLSEEPAADEQPEETSEAVAQQEEPAKVEQDEQEVQEPKADAVETVSTSTRTSRPDQKLAPKQKRDQKADRAERKERAEKVEPVQEKQQARPAPKKEKVKPKTKKEEVQPVQLPEVKPNQGEEVLSQSQYRQAKPRSAKQSYNQF